MINLTILRALVAFQTGVDALIERARSDERGQSMAEYALLLIGVGALAVFVFKWLKDSGLMEGLFKNVIGRLIGGN